MEVSIVALLSLFYRKIMKIWQKVSKTLAYINKKLYLCSENLLLITKNPCKYAFLGIHLRDGASEHSGKGECLSLHQMQIFLYLLKKRENYWVISKKVVPLYQKC